MRSGKDMVKWCLKQNRGIKLAEPNPVLCREYLKKARGSLNMLTAATERGEDEWAATIAYYARYYAVYALFQRCGIISEIHDCTIAAFGYLFADERIVDSSLHRELLASKDSRIDAQYYVMEEPAALSGEDASKARGFVLAIEQALDKLGEEMIGKIRGKLKEVLIT